MRNYLFLVALFFLFVASCIPRAIPPEKQYREVLVSASMKETFKAVWPSLAKYSYRVVEADIAIGRIMAEKMYGRSSVEKLVVVIVSAVDTDKSYVKINLIARKHDKRDGYRRLYVPDKSLDEIERILLEIRHLVES